MLGRSSTIGYESGLPIAITDPIGNTTSDFYDAAGRRLSITTPSGGTTSFLYDNDNQMTSSVDPLGHKTTVEFDADGDITKITDPNKGSARYVYNNADEQVSYRSLGFVSTASYDLAGALTSTKGRMAPSTRSSTTRSDENPLRRSVSREVLRRLTPSHSGTTPVRLTNIKDAVQGSVSRQYNLANDLVNEQTAQGTLAYTYDNDGNRQTMTAPGLPQTNYFYDADNNLKTIAQGSSSVGFAYDSVNEIKSVSCRMATSRTSSRPEMGSWRQRVLPGVRPHWERLPTPTLLTGSRTQCLVL